MRTRVFAAVFATALALVASAGATAVAPSKALLTRECLDETTLYAQCHQCAVPLAEKAIPALRPEQAAYFDKLVRYYQHGGAAWMMSTLMTAHTPYSLPLAHCLAPQAFAPKPVKRDTTVTSSKSSPSYQG